MKTGLYWTITENGLSQKKKYLRRWVEQFVGRLMKFKYTAHVEKAFEVERM